jgi:hypothetical protein
LRAIPDIELAIHLRDGDALITRARANLVTLFLDDPETEATHLLFVDADIGFEPEQVVRLISCGADVVAGIYPIKRLNWDKVRKIAETNRQTLRLPAWTTCSRSMIPKRSSSPTVLPVRVTSEPDS